MPPDDDDSYRPTVRPASVADVRNGAKGGNNNEDASLLRRHSHSLASASPSQRTSEYEMMQASEEQASVLETSVAEEFGGMLKMDGVSLSKDALNEEDEDEPPVKKEKVPEVEAQKSEPEIAMIDALDATEKSEPELKQSALDKAHAQLKISTPTSKVPPKGLEEALAAGTSQDNAIKTKEDEGKHKVPLGSSGSYDNLAQSFGGVLTAKPLSLSRDELEATPTATKEPTPTVQDIRTLTTTVISVETKEITKTSSQVPKNGQGDGQTVPEEILSTGAPVLTATKGAPALSAEPMPSPPLQTSTPLTGPTPQFQNSQSGLSDDAASTPAPRSPHTTPGSTPATHSLASTPAPHSVSSTPRSGTPLQNPSPNVKQLAQQFNNELSVAVNMAIPPPVDFRARLSPLGRIKSPLLESPQNRSAPKSPGAKGPSETLEGQRVKSPSSSRDKQVIYNILTVIVLNML